MELENPERLITEPVLFCMPHLAINLSRFFPHGEANRLDRLLINSLGEFLGALLAFRVTINQIIFPTAHQ